jgi:hypothetical protein
MKLNADIIYDNLKQTMTVESYGHYNNDFALKRPEFFNSDSPELKKNHLYVSRADWLPRNPVLNGDAVIVCVGGQAPIAYLTDKCICFLIKDDNLFAVFNALLKIFDKYEEWEDGLQRILNTTASIQEMIELSFPIIGNPMFVIDVDFRFLAHSRIIDTQDNLAVYRPDENNSFSHSAISESINNDKLEMSVDKPFLVSYFGTLHLGINLFHKNTYAGNLTIHFILRQQRQSDLALAQHLAKMIEKSFNHFAAPGERSDVSSGIVQDILKGFPIDSKMKRHLEKYNRDGQYVCINIKLGNISYHRVPMGYICNLLENLFCGCITFEYESAAVTFINLKELPYSYTDFCGKIGKLLNEMDLKAGISYSFSDLLMARYYYRQACIAYDLGSAASPDSNFYPFRDYILQYMITNCTGEFPQELLFAPGVRELLEYDMNSSANYVHTLRTFLKNNMNTTQTSKDLFVHRSTFNERLKRIQSILQVDLDDPGQRLHLLMTLELIEISEQLTPKPTTAILNSVGKGAEKPSQYIEFFDQ